MAEPVLLFTDPAMLAHDPGPGHPERPARLEAALAALRARPVEGTVWRAPRPATREQVARVHDPVYIDAVEALRGQYAVLDGDTFTSPRTVEAAWLAAGAAIDAVEAVVGGGATRLRAGPPARPPRRARPRDGLLLLQQRRGRGRPRAGGAGLPAGADRRLGRAPRQRHAARFRGARRRAGLQHAPGPALPGNGRCAGDGARGRGGVHRECPATARLGRRRARRGLRGAAGTDRRGLPSRTGAGLGGVRCARRRPAVRHGGHGRWVRAPLRRGPGDRRRARRRTARAAAGRGLRPGGAGAERAGLRRGPGRRPRAGRPRAAGLPDRPRRCTARASSRAGTGRSDGPRGPRAPKGRPRAGPHADGCASWQAGRGHRAGRAVIWWGSR